MILCYAYALLTFIRNFQIVIYWATIILCLVILYKILKLLRIWNCSPSCVTRHKKVTRWMIIWALRTKCKQHISITLSYNKGSTLIVNNNILKLSLTELHLFCVWWHFSWYPLLQNISNRHHYRHIPLLQIDTVIVRCSNLDMKFAHLYISKTSSININI